MPVITTRLRQMLGAMRDRFYFHRIKREVARDARAKADRFGLSFAVGDRVRAVDHDRVDDEGAYGCVVERNRFHPTLKRFGVMVRFDSMPFAPLWMAASELEYDRRFQR